MEKGRSVLVFTIGWRFSYLRLSGIFRFARQHGWSVRVFEASDADERFRLDDAISLWGIDGCIVDGLVVNPSRFAKIPIVCFDPDPEKTKGTCHGVSHDSRASVSLALSELLSLGYPNYAFAGFCHPHVWTKERVSTFLEVTSNRGIRQHVLPDGNGDVVRHMRRLAEWVVSLPRPCGILAVNDRIGAEILQICRRRGIAVPDEIAVVGIDNDELICENCEPTLTSAAPDFEESGHMAAKMLETLMSGGKVCPREVFSTPRIVHRRSTRKFNAGNVRLVKAVEYIRLHACEGIDVTDVVQMIGCDRRSAERRFREMTGHTILSEIQEVRFARACAILDDPARPIDQVAGECGYADESTFRRFFKRRSGMSPSAWRRKALSQNAR